MRRRHVTTTRQMIRCVYGLRATPFGVSVINDDSTLMDMDAPAVLPAGSTMRLEPLRDHPDHHDYFVVRETICFRESPEGWR